MDTRILKDMITVIKAEQLRREEQLDSVDRSYQNDQWQFTDMPFVNELYLMTLVTLRHQVERELVKIAAQEGHGGKEISGQDYANNVQQQRESLRRGKWGELEKRLKLERCIGYEDVEVLRFLANSYKHDPWVEPDKKLLKLLNSKTNLRYALLPESLVLQQDLAIFVGLGKDAAYCDIAVRFVDAASSFLEAVPKQLVLSPVKWGPVSMKPGDFLH